MHPEDCDGLESKTVPCNFYAYVSETPTVDAVPVRCGRWVDYGNGAGLFCSECKHKIHYRNGIKETTVFSDGKFEFVQHPVRNGYYDFCPKCGADMRDGEVFMRGERDEDH